MPGRTRPGLSRSLTNRQNTQHFTQTDTWHDQMVILYYEIHSVRIIDVPVTDCNDMLPTSQGELALPSNGSWLPSSEIVY